MRIKRFLAPDMRTALRMVREEQGPDAVILSNRPAEGGIEVVAATDYDESLMQQALRVAAPGLETVRKASVGPLAMPRDTMPRDVMGRDVMPDVSPIAVTMPVREAAPAQTRADAMIAAMSAPAAAPVRESIASRARAVFRIGDGSTATPAASTSAVSTMEHVPSTPTIPRSAAAPETPESRQDHGGEFRALLARLAAAEPRAPILDATAIETAAGDDAANDSPATPAVAQSADIASDDREAPQASTIEPIVEAAADTLPANAESTTPTLHAVPAEDPALAMMRTELATMRQLMEKQMGDFAVERLRGSPIRAMVYDTLIGYGCDENFAQVIATRIDPRLDPAQARAQMLEELGSLIAVNRAEPIDDGGVIALVGPTGAGKTTTAAKLAARFAARHRARDVALVTTDTERLGAREQLHAHGRRLGITVCEAEGPQALAQTLEQLTDYPLVLVDTAGYATRDRAMLGQILWLRTSRCVRSLLVLPANAHPHDLGEVARRYRAASPEGVVLTKVDETGRLGAALSILHKQNLSLAYTTGGQQVPDDIDLADPTRLVGALEKLRRAADNPLATEDRHAVA
jgi:flagellar biosynthesis protein FlhF